MTQHFHTKKIPTLSSYVTGFLLSLLLTLATFGFVFKHIASSHQLISHTLLIEVIVVLSFVQLLVQSVFFLHLSLRPSKRVHVMAYVFTLFIVAFIVIGSLWIMQNLASNMSHQEVESYLDHQD